MGLRGVTVMETGGRDFPNAQAAEASPLAEALFAIGQVDGVYFGRDFISVSAAPEADWPTLEADVLTLLLDHFTLDAPLFRQGSAAGIDVAPADGFDWSSRKTRLYRASARSAWPPWDDWVCPRLSVR